MKKLFVFAALAAPLFLFSCAKEIEKVAENSPEASKGFAFKASIENLDSPTKADINASNQLVWAAGDKIGVYVNDGSWGQQNQPFVLVGEGGSTNGGFKWDVEPAQDFTNTNATVAFFPWNGTNSSTDNNVYEGTLYFKLPEGYYSYTSGKMLTPLVAQITRNGEDYNQIQFAHAGAAVKVTINNLPVGAKSIGLSVDDKQIHGDWHVNPANAGTEAMSLDAAENTALNDVWLNFDPIAAERSYTFLFPVPTLPASSKLSFDIYDKNDIKVWSAGARTKGDVALGRAEVLEMPALDITPYKQFNSVSAEWTVIGTVNGTNWNADIPMVTDGSICIAKGVSFEAGGEFKVRQNKSWETPNVAYPSSNYYVAEAGIYDIIFDPTLEDSKKVKLVSSELSYPRAFAMDGDMAEWYTVDALTSTGTSRIRSWKFYGDKDNLYFYLVLRKNRMRTAYPISIAFDVDESGSLSADNLSGAEFLVKFQPFTNADSGTPSCVNGTISKATINGVDDVDVTIKAYGLDPDPSTDDSADYYLEVSIPRSTFTGFPAKGTAAKIGVGYEWYKTDYQSVTL